ncbi:hypothetical protein JCGZ_23037 [Jatropha curcas]|uniref:Receptor-like serine/threonine-protein kinase n=1 Tax=Jatropha curcas TaxID=180498 RepID=A0A067LHY6_JATCU|nr:hypothetical protein JCGZ_23037 [Jatropha curcas]
MKHLIVATPLNFIFIIFSLGISFPFSSSTLHNALHEGSSLSVEKPDNILHSSNGIFSAGFYPVGENAYSFAIWFTQPSCFNTCTVVWMANRDIPVNGERSKLSLQKTANLILTDAGNSIIWSSDTFSLSPSSLNLYDNGNLVLITTKERVILWQSFDSPTETLLPLQPFTRNSVLVSSRSSTNFSSGFYKLSFDNDNILRLVYDGPEVSSAFWPSPWLLSREAGRSSYNSSRFASLDLSGKFTSSDNFSFLSSDYGVQNIQRRLTLDFDGNLRLYSRENGNSKWVISWQVFAQSCKIHGACGPNSVCKYDPSFGRNCSCLPGFKMKNVSDWSLGCESEIDDSCGASNASFLKFARVEMYGYDLGYFENHTYDMCKEICLKRCDCKGFVFKYIFQNRPDNVPYCFPKTQLLNGYRSPNFRGNFYLKVPETMRSHDLSLKERSLECSIGAVENLERRFKISVGTAKGLAYLHEECLEWVIHCDIKPHNILLDSNYQPKVSDFGLSRLFSRDDLIGNSGFSRVRGTRGYMAPEWIFNLPITSKVDVYSYGIVVLEMITGRSPSMAGYGDNDGEEVENMRLVEWVMEKKRRASETSIWVKEIVDPVLGVNYDAKKMESLIRVALKCVGESKDGRPTMSQVVEMILQLESYN